MTRPYLTLPQRRDKETPSPRCTRRITTRLARSSALAQRPSLWLSRKRKLRALASAQLLSAGTAALRLEQEGQQRWRRERRGKRGARGAVLRLR